MKITESINAYEYFVIINVIIKSSLNFSRNVVLLKKQSLNGFWWSHQTTTVASLTHFIYQKLPEPSIIEPKMDTKIALLKPILLPPVVADIVSCSMDVTDESSLSVD